MGYSYIKDIFCFRRNGQRRRGSGAAPYVRECFNCLKLKDGDIRIERLLSGKASKVDIMGAGGSLLQIAQPR